MMNQQTWALSIQANVISTLWLFATQHPTAAAVNILWLLIGFLVREISLQNAEI